MYVYVISLIAASAFSVVGFGLAGARNFRMHDGGSSRLVSRYRRSTRIFVVGSYLAFLVLTLVMTRVLSDDGGLYDRAVMAAAYVIVSLSMLSVLNQGLITHGEKFVYIDRWGRARPFHGSQVRLVESSCRNGGAYRIWLTKDSFVISRRMENADAVVGQLQK